MRWMIPVLLLLALPARANDVLEIMECVDANPGAVEAACFGIVATRCQQAPEMRTAMGTVDCLGRETEVWDGIRNAAYRQLRAGLSEAEAAALKAAQLGWIADRDGTRGFVDTYFYRYSGSASAEWGALCRRDMTARRAVLIDGWLRRIEDF